MQAGSGVGTAGIQISHHAGAKVFVTAGTSEKIENCKALGAVEGINYKENDFVSEISTVDRWTGRRCCCGLYRSTLS